MRAIPRTIGEHVRLRFPKGEEALRYNVLQKLAYLSVVVALFPLLILAGLTMSPGMDAAFPWLSTCSAGASRRAPCISSLASYLVVFVFVHLAMVLAVRGRQQPALDDHRALSHFGGRAMMRGTRIFQLKPAFGAGLRAPRSSLSRRQLLLGSPPAAAHCRFGMQPRFPLARRDVDPRQGRGADRERPAALLSPRTALAPEFPQSAISAYFKPNGSIDPDDPAYVALRRSGFADWKLEVDGLVERPMKLSLADLRQLPSRTADHPPRLRRGLELHRPVERRAAVGRCSTQRGSSRRRAISRSSAPTTWSRRSTPADAITRASICSTPITPRPSSPMRCNVAPLTVAMARRSARVERQLGYKHGQVRDAHRGGRQLRRHRAADAAATGRTAAMNGTRESEHRGSTAPSRAAFAIPAPAGASLMRSPPPRRTGWTRAAFRRSGRSWTARRGCRA